MCATGCCRYFRNCSSRMPAMQALIDKMREPHAAAYAEKIATADRLLYRRGNFSGTVDQLICDALRGEFDAEIALSPGFRWGTSVLPGQPVTMEDVLAETAITYPETYVQSMTGSQIKDILEDVCDNLFNADPYYQQGGDMVRVGGFAYTCTPAEAVGRRISDLKLDNGRAIEAGKSYKVAGWASVNEQKGTPVWDVFAKHLRSRKTPDRARRRRHPEGRRRQSGHRGTGMRHLLGHRRSMVARFGNAVMAALMLAMTPSARPGPAGAAAGQAVRRAPHRAAALGQRSEEARPRDQRRQQSAETLRSRQGRDRGGGVRSGHRSAAPRTMPTASWSRAWSRRACGSTSASIPSIPSSAKPASGRKSFPPRRRFRSASDKFCR